MVVQNYFPQDPRVRRYVHSLHSVGIFVDTICIGNEGDKKSEYYLNGRIIRKILPKKRSNRFRYLYEYFLFWLFAFFTINKLINREEYIAIHFHTLPDFLVFSGYYARNKGIKLILDLHEILPEFYAVKFNILKKSLIFKILKYIEKISVNYADFIITINDAIKQLVESRTSPKSEIKVIMNTVDSEIVRKRVAKPHNNFNIFYTGTILKISGLQYVIKALYNLGNNNIKFHILGEGPYRPELEELVNKLDLSECIKFYGFINQEKLPDYLSICDVGIIPQENNIMIDYSFANKLAEFIYHKIPVIATELSSTKDYFDSNCIYFTKSGDTNSIEKAILKLYSSKDIRKKLSDNASLKYENIKWCIMQKRYIDLINSMIY